MAMTWAGVPNGEIPASKMVEFEVTGKYLQADAAHSLTIIFDLVKAETDYRPYISSEQDLYRDLAEQIALLRRNYHIVKSGGSIVYSGQRWAKNSGAEFVTCATPGTSNHGAALAADISFPTAACRLSFRRLCVLHGWTNAGDAFGEDWHKEYHGPILTLSGETKSRIDEPKTTPEEEEDEMKPVWIYYPVDDKTLRFAEYVPGTGHWTEWTDDPTNLKMSTDMANNLGIHGSLVNKSRFDQRKLDVLALRK